MSANINNITQGKFAPFIALLIMIGSYLHNDKTMELIDMATRPKEVVKYLPKPCPVKHTPVFPKYDELLTAYHSPWTRADERSSIKALKLLEVSSAEYTRAYDLFDEYLTWKIQNGL